ncbi:SRPBCC domain-containing protein [Actinoalloteichus caeruleus]|uniref:SRPBCC domain-containing protein n=1 Tax=Actinoalloteichus cyanogriseus TaxID=2893586 RepID=UPI003BB8A368
MSLDGNADRIERDILIEAPPRVVWDLVSEPGWWINGGEITPHEIQADGDARVLVRDPEHGVFAVETVDSRPHEYIAFRWYGGPSEAGRVAALGPGNSTLVEFLLRPVGTSSVRLRVVESGFAELDETALLRRRMLDDNTEGWRQELAALHRHVGRTAR